MENENEYNDLIGQPLEVGTNKTVQILPDGSTITPWTTISVLKSEECFKGKDLEEIQEIMVKELIQQVQNRYHSDVDPEQVDFWVTDRKYHVSGIRIPSLISRGDETSGYKRVADPFKTTYGKRNKDNSGKRN